MTIPTEKTIVAGNVKEGVEDWLRTHGARVEHHMGLCIARLPEKADVHQDIGATRWHVTVGFEGDDGEDEPVYLDIETSEDDAMDTVWELKED